MFKALGANPVPMAAPEVYTAIQTGVIDGWETPLDADIAWKTMEVAKFTSLTGHQYADVVLCISDKVFQGFPKNIQTLVVETISMRTDVWADTTPVMFSEKMRITERIRRVDANTMENQMTITDPVAFTKPWTFVKHYTLMKKGTWVSEPEKCGGPEDRNPIVNGRVISVMPGVK